MDSIKRAGGWSNSAVDKSYLAKSLALDCCRALAGFNATRGQYYIARASLEPSNDLINKIFPVDRIAADIDEFKRTARVTHEIAGSQFLKLIRQLAITFIQDSVVLMSMVCL